MNPSRKFTLTFEKYVKEGGWCSFAFLQLTIVLIEFWKARGVEAKFRRTGPIIFKHGVEQFMITTGYTPSQRFNMPLNDRATNYVHVIGLDGVPLKQVHASEQEQLVIFLNTHFADLLAQYPMTAEEAQKISDAVSFGNQGNIGDIPFLDEE